MPTNQIAPSKILIAEDHELFSDGIQLLLQQTFPTSQIEIADNYPRALQLLKEDDHIDLLLLDIKLPGTSALNGLKEIKQTFATLTIIVISALDLNMNIQQILDLGANGFIAKSTCKQDMKQAILDILDGDLVVKSDADNATSNVMRLSDRQLATLTYLAEGKTNKEIAAALNIMPSTAKEHVSKILSQLGAENRTQAVLNAQRIGLLI